MYVCGDSAILLAQTVKDILDQVSPSLFKRRRANERDTVDVQGETEVLRVRAAPSTPGQAEANTIVNWSGLCHGLDLG